MNDSSEHEVVITGLGLVSPEAHTADELFERLERGLSSVRVEERYATYGFPHAASGFIPDSTWDIVEGTLPSACADAGESVKLAYFAAKQALVDSGVDLTLEARKGVFVASNRRGLDDAEVSSLSAFFKHNDDRVDLDAFIRQTSRGALTISRSQQEAAALLLSETFGMDDVVMTHSDACAAGGIAIGSAYRLIKHGELDIAVAGGAECMCSMLTLAGFSLLGALCPRAFDGPETISRPFDRSRSGFVMGEGGAFLVLESMQHARRRKARVLGKVLGFAKVMEAWRLTSSPRDGSEYARCMRAALADARMTPEDVDHVNAHGTSTQANDGCESAAIHQVFGERGSTIPVTANKSALGHAFAAAGAIEAVLSVLSLQRSVLLPTLNFREADAGCAPLNLLHSARRQALRTIMSNSFGFGGENCSLVLGGAACDPDTCVPS